MKALAIDCGAESLFVAAKNDGRMSSLFLDGGVRQSERIVSALGRVMDEAEVSSDALDYVALSMGPGSFTALRLALSVAKAFRFSFGMPIYGIPTLDAYSRLHIFLPYVVLCAIDARRGCFYAKAFASQKELLPAADLSPDEITSFLLEDASGRDALLCGPGGALLHQKIAGKIKNRRIFCAPFSLDASCCFFDPAEKMIRDGVEPLKDFSGPLYIRAESVRV